MVKVTFKNVNQGDSIILEWKKDDNRKIAIVDCNNYNKNINPVLNHIIDEKVQEIDFMLMTHPHLDHFSGFFDLISHCRSNNITINRFLHTSRITSDYLKFASRNAEEKKRIFKLFKLLDEMQDNDEILVGCVEENGFARKLNDEFCIEFLAPSSKEFDEFIRSGSYGFDNSQAKKFDGNWLSTIVNIFSDKSMILLTSDCPSEVFDRLIKSLSKRGRNQKIILGQIPHHGSEVNFSKRFWSGVKKNQNTYAVISVGENSYGHPSEKIENFFYKNNNYTLLRTDSNSSLVTKKSRQMTTILNVASKKNEKITYEEVLRGDKSFIITNSNCQIV